MHQQIPTGDHRMTSIAKSKQNRPSCASETSHHIPNCRRLTRDEEHELAALVANGDVNARNEFVQANLPLVIKIARSFQGRGLALDDLVGEGNLGLIRATKEFRPAFGTRFSTYAAYWIKESIRHALINTTTTIRLPAHMLGTLAKWRRAERDIANERGETPRFDEVAAVLGLSESQKMLVGKARQALWFGPHRNNKLDPDSCDCEKVWNRSGACEERLEANEAHHMLVQRMQRLDKRESTVLELRYGLAGEAPLTLKEIGLRLEVTREWAGKIELRALGKLRDEQYEIESDSKLRKRVRSKRQIGLPCLLGSSQASQPG
jgi:RNA polymerase primary sigma factor